MATTMIGSVREARTIIVVGTVIHIKRTTTHTLATIQRIIHTRAIITAIPIQRTTHILATIQRTIHTRTIGTVGNLNEMRIVQDIA